MSRPLTLYYRTRCHLCEQMLAELHARYGEELQVRLVDVDGDAGLRARFGLQVPVLVGGETVLAAGRLDCGRLEDYLSAG